MNIFPSTNWLHHLPVRLNSSTPPKATLPPQNLPYKRLPHVLQPKILITTAAFTGSYLFYLWYSDKEVSPTNYPNDFKAVVYRRLPSNAFSHFIGAVGDIKIPTFLRSFLFGIYTKLTHCNMTEAKEPDIKKYSTLGELFCRELAPASRPLDASAFIICPCDGTVVYAGPVEDKEKMLAEIKGKIYNLEEFLGPLPTENGLLKGKEAGKSQLLQCVIYLCPGDYHRFHSPTDWTIKVRRHFTGKLLPVSPPVIKRLSGVFTINERVAYLGEWRYGFMSLTAVGATGVGSVVAAGSLDPCLSTNQRRSTSKEATEPGLHFHERIIPAAMEKIPVGAPFGLFKMGSSIVLVFEAPAKGFEWSVKPGDKVKFGQALMVPEKD
ncbi:hypothetical protein Aperf_G00000126308 [Anoplocephala perfoliata]